MLEIGKVHQLEVIRVDERGIWLLYAGESILLPQRDAAETVNVGEKISVFLYRDRNGELRTTLQLPQAQVGEFAYLRVKTVGRHGAFLDWGAEKDLLVPLSQQPERMQPGRNYLVRIALDREGRPFASARLDDWLQEECIEISAGEKVELLLWTFTDLGAKVIVNHRYSGLLYRDELRQEMRPGIKLSGYIKRVREDGKLDITLRRVGSEGAAEARETILAALNNSPFLPLNDQSPPEQIHASLGMSKKSFKKAAGSLMKAGLIEMTDKGIRLKEKG